MTKEGGKAHAAYEVLLALGRELGEARLEVVALNHLAILTFHQQDTDPPRVRRLLEEARGVAEEGAALSRELAERPAPRTHLPSMLVGVMGLVASWRAGTNGIEIRCLNFLAYDTILQGRTVADPEQDRRSLRAAWGERRSARSVLPGGADH
jgi:hypothetical protein